MNKLYTIFFILNVSLAFSQEGLIEYGTKYRKQEAHKSDIRLAKVIKEHERMVFSLRFKKEESFFQNLPHIPDDDLSLNIAKVFANASKNWYQNAIQRTANFNKKINKKTYLIVTERYMRNWNLQNESKQIEGYKCYKAILTLVNDRTLEKYNIVAWYSPQISAPFGPAGFGGLPGLILQLDYKNTIYIAKKINLNPKEGIKAYPKMNFDNKINEKQMIKLLRAQRKVTPD